MANPRALAIKAQRAQNEAQAELDTQTKLLIAIAENLGIDVRKVLSGELPDFSEPVETVEPTADPMAEAKAFKSAGKK